MNRYEPGTPRTIVGCAAMLMSALTLAVCVIGPAAIDSSSGEANGVMTSSEPPLHATAGPGEITTTIDVVAVRTAGRNVQTCAHFRNDLAS